MSSFGRNLTRGVAARIKSVAVSTLALSAPLAAQASDTDPLNLSRIPQKKVTNQSFLTPEEQKHYQMTKQKAQKALEQYAKVKAMSDVAKPLIQADQIRYGAVVKARQDAASLQDAQDAARLQAQAAIKANADYQASLSKKSEFRKNAEAAEKANNAQTTPLIARLHCESSLKVGKDGHLTVTTLPNAECHTILLLGAAGQKILPDLTANEDGIAEFTFPVPDVHRGYLVINTECRLGSAHVIQMKKVEVVR